MKKKIRIIVKDTVPRKKIEKVGWDNDWLFHDMTPRGENNPYEKIWTAYDKETVIHYIEDFLIDVNYFLIEGNKADKIVKQINNSLDTYRVSEVLQMAKNSKSRNVHIRALYYSAIVAPQHHETRFFKIFKTASLSKDAEIRHAVIAAIGYMGWPEFKEILQQLKTGDEDESVRHDAGLMLEALYTQAKVGGDQ